MFCPRWLFLGLVLQALLASACGGIVPVTIGDPSHTDKDSLLVGVADDNAKALVLLKGVENERLKYDCFHIRYAVSWSEQGTVVTLEQVVDFEEGKIRKIYPSNDVFGGKKSILLEDIVYSMMTYDDKHVAIAPRTSTNAYAAGAYDPRLLGLTDVMNHRTDIGHHLMAVGTLESP